MAVFMEGMNPFLIFPEEVWVMILDKVEDSRDAWNLLKAFPELDVNAALQKKKRFWLFGLVIPHLIPWRESSWIEENDLISCRRVCMKWSASAAVDGFLESQPQLLAYRPETQSQVAQLSGPGRFHWNLKAYLDKRDEDGEINKPAAHFGGTLFDILHHGNDDDESAPPRGSLKRFLRETKDHDQGRNPFLSRMLTLFTWESWDEYDGDGPDPLDFFDDILLLHRKFGEHVWFYKLNFRLESSGASCMTKYMTYLPNLKMLHLVVEDGDTPTPSDANVQEFLELVGKALPPLPFLETLRIEECPHPFSHFLISRLAAQIRRLDLQFDLWRDEYAKLFPNLTEFEISDLRVRPDGDQMKKLLFSLEAPQLSKLQVKFPSVDQEHLRTFPFVIEDDVFQWLRRFPNLKFLDLGYGCRYVCSVEHGTLNPVHDSISSLQFLAIQTSFEMNYNFLTCLPSLQHLQLYVSSKPFVIDLSTNPVVKILDEIQAASMYKSNIWVLLPKLKTIALVVEDYDGELAASYAFNREGYEFERRRISSGLSVGRGDDDDEEPAPLRKDIIDFLQEEVDYVNDLPPRLQSDSEGDRDDDDLGEEEFEEVYMDEGSMDFDFEDDSDLEGDEEEDEEWDTDDDEY